ncbi:MAG: nucleotidyltransferase domain-containing protein [Defluviitaleaceae bacterium]|nr:nucleotidyltransferase domain-containing protein [Defluviitaleaceae bacterium]
MNEQSIKNIMQEAVEVSHKAFGDILRQVWLFGSYARGEANSDSDVDFMVVLSEPVETWKYICTVYNDFTVDIINRYGEFPSVFITHEVNFIEEPTQLYKNVKKEGVLVYG